MAEQAEILDPASSLRWFVATQGGHRGFCSICGSPMFFKSDRWPGELHIARALIEESIEQPPQSHAYYDSHVPWVTLGDALPKSHVDDSS